MSGKRLHMGSGGRLRRTGYVALVLGMVCVAALGIGVGGVARAQDDREVRFFEPVKGVLSDGNPLEEWVFWGFAGQVVSLIVETTDGNLDPVLEVIGPDGFTVATNDDLDSLVRDAGLEALSLPLSGRYTARVSRYQGEAGTTAGAYELRLTPGFARLAHRSTFDQGDVSWVTPDGEPVALAQGRLQMRVTGPDQFLLATPPEDVQFDDMYLQVAARVFGTPPYAEYGLAFRGQGRSFRRSYLFKVNTEGEWRVLYQDESGTYALRTWTRHETLDTANDRWTLGVLVRGDTFAFYANDTLLGTVEDARLESAGAIGVFVATDDKPNTAATVLFDDVTVTTRLGTTYSGLPLALTNWDAADPADVVGELAAGGHIAPAERRDLYLLEKSLMAMDRTALFELVGSEQAIYDDFVLGARVTIVTGGESVGCGLVYRWQDERNLDLAFVDSAGGFGVVQARDGELVTNAYDLSPMVQERTNKLLVIAQGGHIALYINGALVAQETVAPGDGRAGVALLNYEDVRTDCFWSDIWVWPLAE